MIGYPAKPNTARASEFIKISVPFTTPADRVCELFLVWSRRIEGAPLHAMLLEVLNEIEQMRLSPQLPDENGFDIVEFSG